MLILFYIIESTKYYQNMITKLIINVQQILNSNLLLSIKL